MEKHTRPYICSNAACNGADFGDKAGLQRHEKERHGPIKFFCPVASCSRHRRGFPRKWNLDSHIAARHEELGAKGAKSATAVENSQSPNTEMEQPKTADEATNIANGTETLSSKLEQLEIRKKELAESQAAVDADIRAVKRAMLLMTSNL
jgi:hypothetical protein